MPINYHGLIIPTIEDSRKLYGKLKPETKKAEEKPQNLKYMYLKYSEELKLSPLAKTFLKNGIVALFHPFTMKRVYGGEELKIFLRDIKKGHVKNLLIGKKLFELGFLVPNNFSKQEFIEKFRNIRATGQEISLMYLIITDKCNFDCKYCFIEQGALKGKQQYGNMSYKTAKATVDFFIRQIKKDREKKIILYGGEPLLNFDVVKKTVEYIRTKEKKGLTKGPISISLLTNGYSLTKEMCEFFSKNNVNLGISIDGPKKIHDSMRTLINGSGTFNTVLKSLKLLTSYDKPVGVSCTIAEHNVNQLEKIVEYFHKIGVKSIGFNILRTARHQKELNVEIERVTDALIAAYKKCRKFGINEDRVFRRRIVPFVEESFWIRDCAGYGGQIVVLPNGSVGPCHGFIGSKNFFVSNAVYTDIDICSHSMWKKWFRRAPLFMKDCWDCAVIGLCGGGCAKQAYEDFGSIWAKDKRTCVFVNKVLEWLIWEEYAILCNS